MLWSMAGSGFHLGWLAGSTGRRVAIAGGLAAGFVLIAMSVEPRGSVASEGERDVFDPNAALPAGMNEIEPSLGSLVGSDVTVTILAAPGGPRYRVVDDATGRVLVDDASAEIVDRAVPELGIERLVGEQLMLADIPLD